jgi:hypothetical protein
VWALEEAEEEHDRYHDMYQHHKYHDKYDGAVTCLRVGVCV